MTALDELLLRAETYVRENYTGQGLTDGLADMKRLAEEVKAEIRQEQARRLRRRARTMAMLHSEAARLTAKGLHIGADILDPDTED